MDRKSGQVFGNGDGVRLGHTVEDDDANKSVPVWSTIPALNNDDPKVVLLGDSVLDNFIWLEDPKLHTRVQLEKMLRNEAEFKHFRCVNLAVDQMSTFDLEERDPQQNSWRSYAEAKRRVYFSSDQDRHYYVCRDGFVRSIENLKRLKNVRVVVLSIGGNDVYLQPRIQSELCKSLLPFQSYRRLQVAEAFGTRLDRILQSIKAAVPDARIIPVLPYHPHYDFSLLGMQSDSCFGYVATTAQKWLLSRLVTPIARQSLALAQRHHLSVIDLSATFDPKNERHYGTGDRQGTTTLASWSGAEPSVISTSFICRLVIDAVKHEGGFPTVRRGIIQDDELKGVIVERNVGDYPSRYVFGPR